MAYELNGQSHKRDKWDHSKTCDYCKSRGLPLCKHVRGGKTAAKRRAARTAAE